MASKEDKLFILECLTLYKNLPALWNMKTKEYRSRTIKNEQYDLLLCKFRERFPEADRNQVVRKINSLRTNYRKELKRIKRAEKSESTLWYFDAFRFLDSVTLPFDTESRIKIEMVDDYENVNLNAFAESNNITEMERDNLSYTRDVLPKKKLKKKNSLREKIKPVFDKEWLEQPDKLDSECERIALAWAVDLEKMCPLQQLFAKKAINDILFEGQMGTLHRDSVQINKSNRVPSRSSTPCSSSSPNLVIAEQDSQ